MSAGGGGWDLSGSDFSLSFGVDLIVNLLVKDLDVSKAGFFSILGVGVYVWFRFISILDGDGVDGSDKGKGEFHGEKEEVWVLFY